MTEINKAQMEQLARDLEARRKTGMNLHSADYRLHYDSEQAITALLRRAEEAEADNEHLRHISFRDERDKLRADLAAAQAELAEIKGQKPYAFMAETIFGSSALSSPGADGSYPVYRNPVTPAQVPDGWKLVPVELTYPMICAAHRAIEIGAMDTGIWKAMLSAAPTPEKK